MSVFLVDVESDGQIPGDYSMISFGAVMVRANGDLSTTFYGKLKPISDKWIPENLAVSGHTREETMTFEDPKKVMYDFGNWVLDNSNGRPMFISDNNGFDFAFINWYFHHFTGGNPFGHSSTNLGSLYKGMVGNMSKNFKHLRKTKHTHNPVQDSMGNAEAFLYMINNMNLKVRI